MIAPDRLNQIRKYRNGSDIVTELTDHIDAQAAQLTAIQQVCHEVLDTSKQSERYEIKVLIARQILEIISGNENAN